MQLVVGQTHVTHSLRDAAYNLAHGVETSVWVTMLEHHTNFMDGIVTVSTTLRTQQVLHSLEP